METSRILVVDDDAGARRAVVRVLGREGYGLDSASSGAEALDRLSNERFDLVLTDVRMERMSGTELLREIRRTWPDLPVIVMTAFAGVDTAVSSIDAGAFDYISKPYEIDELRATVRRALEHGRLQKAPDLRAGSDQDDASGDDFGIIGTSPAMAAVYKQIALVARSEATALIQGESGSGKERVARAIHRNSVRRTFPFLAVNCGAFTESLLETELFGHVRGAFTGASAQRAGLFETANRGTVFLDEIAETTPSMQTRLLRVLEEREVKRVGSMESIPVDIRIVAASNRNLDELVRKGAFREDLYYRLNVVEIDVPPLRHRLSDIPLLFDAFVRRYGGRRATPIAVDPQVMGMLAAWHWPGNVRELENAVERAVALNTTGILTPGDFSEELRGQGPRAAVFSEHLIPLEEMERQYAEHVVSQVEGNMTRAAEALGIDRRTLYRLLERAARKPEVRDDDVVNPEAGSPPTETD
jgi:DNA-binding NtrC family response regulator